MPSVLLKFIDIVGLMFDAWRLIEIGCTMSIQMFK